MLQHTPRERRSRRRLRRELLHGLSDAAAKCLFGALGALAQECFEVCCLDWIEVWRARRQIAQGRAGSFDRFAYTFDRCTLTLSITTMSPRLSAGTRH